MSRYSEDYKFALCKGQVFNKSLCRLLANKYLAYFEYFDGCVFSEGDSVDIPYKIALVGLRKHMLAEFS
jgi:hypothetical protein